MAAAGIMVGISGGLIAAILALVLGHGLLVAFLAYSGIGACSLLGLCLVQLMRVTRREARYAPDLGAAASVGYRADI